MITASQPSLSPAPSAAGEWLTEAERNPPRLTIQSPLTDAVELFETNVDQRLLPVIDRDSRPLGAIFERDIRKLLLNPYGHALLRNPSYGRSIAPHIRPCPIAEVSLDIGELIDAYQAAQGTEGMILTQGGRLFAVVATRKLVHLAGKRELMVAQSQIERARRIESASERFERHVATLSRSMDELSALIEMGAGAMTERAALTGERATAVATAASQTSMNMGEIADRGRELVEALGAIGSDAARARRAAGEAVTLVTAGSERTRQLLRSAQSIDSVIGLISEIARQVNLLALNATIEAARAGEAGRGFTIVANEVKQLSAQAGSAAERITSHVREIRNGIGEVAEAHQIVEDAIGAMARMAVGVQAAVDSQIDATRSVARNVEEAVEASTGIQHDVEAIGGSSRSASQSAGEMRDLATRLKQGAGALTGQVETFLHEIRAA